MANGYYKITRAGYALACGCVTLWFLSANAGCGGPDRPATPPRLLKSVALADGDEILQPVRLQVLGDTLFASYKGIPRLDVCTLDVRRVRSIDLTDPEPVTPSAFVVSDSQIVVCDHAKGSLVVYSRQGLYVDSFGLLPDQRTRLSPLDLTRYRDVVYVVDMNIKRVLAISLSATPGVVSLGELILQVPADEGTTLGTPSSVFVTPDGRLLIGDAGDGCIKVFTCDGRQVYEFDSVPGPAKIAPQGFALDGVKDPSLHTADSFDPSGVRDLGRIHVADGRGGVVHMFNSLGKHLGSYPKEGRLGGVSDIAIAPEARRIFVADSRARRIHVFVYGGD